jgi:hypothetical protein
VRFREWATRGGALAAFLAATAIWSPAIGATTGEKASFVTTPAAAIKELNAERRANGIPSAIKENTSWSDACAAHVHYMTVNNVLTHPEDSSLSGYTKLGDWAGTNAVLAENAPWLQDANPFETAPLHLIQMLDPALSIVGVDIGSSFLCMTTWPGYTEQSVPQRRIFTFPGDGAHAVPASETARELPATPQQFVGIPVGKTTGPHLFAYGTGFGDAGYDAHVTHASLTGPDGKPVAIKTVDRKTREVGEALPPGSAMIIPVDPLVTGAPYEASITIDSKLGSTSYTWTFKTAGAWGGQGTPKLALHPENDTAVELANTSTTLPEGVAPVPNAYAATGLNAATAVSTPTISIPATVKATGGVKLELTIPDKTVPTDLTIYTAGGTKVGALDGLRWTGKVTGAEFSNLFPALKSASGPSSFNLQWAFGEGNVATVTLTATTTSGILEPGSYKLVVASGGKQSTAHFTVK